MASAHHTGAALGRCKKPRPPFLAPRASRIVRCALNFFLADVRGGLGPFVDKFSVVKGRYPVRLGVIATIRRVLGPIAMTFLGARADSSHRKRLLIVLLAGHLDAGRPPRIRQLGLGTVVARALMAVMTVQGAGASLSDLVVGGMTQISGYGLVYCLRGGIAVKALALFLARHRLIAPPAASNAAGRGQNATGRTLRVSSAMPASVLPIVLLICSNVFMTFAWYGHLKFTNQPLWIVVLASWGIAFFEYWLAVPANRIGHEVYSAAELKTMQEVITLVVFAIFSVFYLGERLTINHAIGFALICLGAFFVFKGPIAS